MSHVTEQTAVAQVKRDEGKIWRKIMIFFLSISLTFVLGAQRNRLSETVLLSTLYIRFG